MPQTYRKACSLLNYLLDIPSSKISWNRHGLVTINGAVVTSSNISELINDAIRERKTVKTIGRIQFARLRHDIAMPSNLIGNRDLLTTFACKSRRIKSTLTRGSSTPKPSRAHSKSRKLNESAEETAFLSTYSDNNVILTSDVDSSSTRKKDLIHWFKLNK